MRNETSYTLASLLLHPTTHATIRLFLMQPTLQLHAHPTMQPTTRLGTSATHGSLSGDPVSLRPSEPTARGYARPSLSKSPSRRRQTMLRSRWRLGRQLCAGWRSTSCSVCLAASPMSHGPECWPTFLQGGTYPSLLLHLPHSRCPTPSAHSPPPPLPHLKR